MRYVKLLPNVFRTYPQAFRGSYHGLHDSIQSHPGRHGRHLAEWLAAQLRARGEGVQDIIAEDWGWCIMLHRKPYMLWIGCGNEDGSVERWGVFVCAEPSLPQRIFQRVDVEPVVLRLEALLKEMVLEIPGVRDVVWETA